MPRSLRWLLPLGLGAVLVWLAWQTGRTGLVAAETRTGAGTGPRAATAHILYVGGGPAGSAGGLALVDTASNSLIPPIINLAPEGNSPFDATLNAASTRMWLAGSTGDGLIVVDTANNQIVQRLPGIGDWPSDIIFSDDDDRAFISVRSSRYVAVVDTTTYAVLTTYPLQDEGGHAARHPCSGDIYVVDYFDDFLTILDEATGQELARLDLGASLWDLVFSPDGSLAYVIDRGFGTTGTPDAVKVFDTLSQSVVATVTVGIDPWGLDLTPDGALLFVANEDDSSVSVVDTALNTVTRTIGLDASADPRDVDVSPDGAWAYVTSGDRSGDDAVYVIDVATLALTDTVVVAPLVNTRVVAAAPEMPHRGARAGFISNSPVPAATVPVVFTDTTGNEPTSWLWDFGDGVGNSTQQNPVYAYANDGRYRVSLTAANACGNSTFTDYVDVGYFAWLPLAVVSR